MAKKKAPTRNTRTYRKSTPESRARHAKAVAETEAELPELKRMARGVFAGLECSKSIIAGLRSARIEQGLSIDDVASITYLDRDVLHGMETEKTADPSVRTLARYAHALGLALKVELTPESVSEPPSDN